MLTVCLVSLLCVGQADQTVETVPAWAKAGCWASRYESLPASISQTKQPQIEASINFSGGKGTYTLHGYKQSRGYVTFNQTGKLTDIHYSPSYPHKLGPPTPAIYGTWQLGQTSGYFVFRAPVNGLFDGYWGVYDQQTGKPSEILGSWDAAQAADPVSDADLQKFQAEGLVSVSFSESSPRDIFEETATFVLDHVAEFNVDQVGKNRAVLQWRAWPTSALIQALRQKFDQVLPGDVR